MTSLRQRQPGPHVNQLRTRNTPSLRARKLAKLSCTCHNLRRHSTNPDQDLRGLRHTVPAPQLRPRHCYRCYLALKERHEAEARQYAHDAGWDSAYDAGWDSGYSSGRLSVLNKELLNDLIQLCHPDRHSARVDLATRVTRQLLELRENTRRAA